jgi:hypothetical protein
MTKRINKGLVLFWVLTFVFVGCIYGQEIDNPFLRTQALIKDGVVYFNVDGIEITAQKKDADFSNKNCVNEFSHLKIKKKQLTTDTLLGIKNYYVFKSIEKQQNFFTNIAYYFVHSPDDYIIAFTFESLKKSDKEFERNFITLACNNRIPQSIYHSNVPDVINFAGREIKLDKDSKWIGVNKLECANGEQLLWSLHKDMADANEFINNQFIWASSQKRVDVVTDEITNVLFEGVEVFARKVVYSHTNKKVLVTMTPVNRYSYFYNVGASLSLFFYINPVISKKLTAYFVAVPVRGYNVSCILSFWESDQINSSGLPPLLEQVMKLK